MKSNKKLGNTKSASGEKKDKAEVNTDYKAPSTFKPNSFYGQKGSSQVYNKGVNVKVQHKG